MEGGVECDPDDVFFADLSKQLYLILDDSEEDIHRHPHPGLFHRCQSVDLQAYPAVVHPTTNASFQRGTGVFIPNPTRKSTMMRQGKGTVPANKFHKPFDHDNTTKVLPNVPYGNPVVHSQDQHSFNIRRA